MTARRSVFSHFFSGESLSPLPTVSPNKIIKFPGRGLAIFPAGIPGKASVVQFFLGCDGPGGGGKEET